MVSIRLAVVTLPPFIIDIVTTLLTDKAALNIVARLDDRAEVQERLRALHPDLILMGLRNGENDNIARALLACLPSTTIIALSGDGRNAFLHEMRPHRRALRNISPRLLIRTVLARSARSEI